MLVISNTEELQALSKNEFRGHLPEMVNSKFFFEDYSVNNIIYCEEGVKLENCAIRMLGSNSVLYLCKSKQPYRVKVMIYHNSVVAFGRDNFYNRDMQAVITEQKNLIIGSENLFSLEIWMRTGDSHLIYEIDSKKRINASKSIYIGDHNWIGQQTLILKGTQISSGTVVGANSVVTGKKIPANTCFAGSPARLTKTGIFWDPKCSHSFRDKETEDSMNFNADPKAHVFEFKEEEYLDYQDIEKNLKAAKTAAEKFEVIDAVMKNTNHNRFSFA